MSGTPTRRARPAVTCRGCHRTRPNHGHRLCAGCYTWWRRHGRPDTVPPPHQRKGDGTNRHQFTAAETRLGAERGHATQTAARLARIEDYGWLLTQGLTKTLAAGRVGVRPVTAREYEAAA